MGRSHMIVKLWLSPPLAVARLGSSPNPCENFEWGPSDTSPGGSGKTTLRMLDSLWMGDDGRIELVPKSDELIFKEQDQDGNWQFRPVCPYFELFGTWQIDGEEHSGAITTDVLNALGLSVSDISWRVRLGNLKAYQFTLSKGDRIECDVTINGTDTSKQQLRATSPHGPSEQKLIPVDKHIPVGKVQLSQPTAEFPEFRLRFYPPSGLVYGPKNLQARIADYEQTRIDAGLEPSEWESFDLADRFILNPKATWSTYEFGSQIKQPFYPARLRGYEVTDTRKTPTQIHAYFPTFDNDIGLSLGLIDDVTDGIIECTIGDQIAFARIAVSPPDFAPDRRHIISIQEGLADRVGRDQIRQTANYDELEELVRDIFERALETSDAMNKDAIRQRVALHNGSTSLPISTGNRNELALGTLWPDPTEQASIAHRSDAMPISSAGSRKHKRYTALEYLRDRLREDPELIEKWIRKPRDEYQLFDRRMPPLMRGSHGGPMNLTQRQYELLTKWVEGLRTQGMI